jgi:hypothetical protein
MRRFIPRATDSLANKAYKLPQLLADFKGCAVVGFSMNVDDNLVILECEVLTNFKGEVQVVSYEKKVTARWLKTGCIL